MSLADARQDSQPSCKGGMVFGIAGEVRVTFTRDGIPAPRSTCIR